MEKFIPYEKLSKKEKRKLDQAKRQTWGNLNPVTRKPENSKAYNRNKARNWKREISRNPVPGLFYFIPFCSYAKKASTILSVSSMRSASFFTEVETNASPHSFVVQSALEVKLETSPQICHWPMMELI